MSSRCKFHIENFDLHSQVVFISLLLIIYKSMEAVLLCMFHRRCSYTYHPIPTLTYPSSPLISSAYTLSVPTFCYLHFQPRTNQKYIN